MMASQTENTRLVELLKEIEDLGIDVYESRAQKIEGTQWCDVVTKLPCKNNGKRLIILSLPS